MVEDGAGARPQELASFVMSDRMLFKTKQRPMWKDDSQYLDSISSLQRIELLWYGVVGMTPDSVTYQL